MTEIFVGVDVGGMSVKAGLCDAAGNIIGKKTAETNPDRDSYEVVDDFAKLVNDLLAENGVDGQQIVGIGIGIPGTVNGEKGIVTYSGNLGFRKVNVVKEMKKFFSCPIKLGNDANCAALGESKFGSGNGSKNAFLVTLGTGVGTGFIVDGKIMTGEKGEGAEGGHICIRMGGEKCTCGQKGCWEAYASATALIRQTEKAIEKYPHSQLAMCAIDSGRVSGRTAFIARKIGDPVAERVVKNYVKYVAAGIVNLVNVFRPEVVMVGGGVSHEGQYFIDMIEKEVRRHAFGGKFNHPPKVVRASLGNDAGIVGAAALTMKENG